jgi:hypothetical protein
MAAQERLDNQIAVDGAGNPLAHPHILQKRVAQIEGQILNLCAARLFHAQIGARRQCRQGIHGQGINGHIRRTLLQFKRLGNGVGHHRETHPLDLWNRGPTQRIALHHHILIDALAHKTERSRAHRMLPEGASAALGNNADCSGREIPQQKIVRAIEMKNHRARVPGFHRIHGGVGRGLG